MRTCTVVVFVVLGAIAVLMRASERTAAGAAAAVNANPDAVCASCHQAIYDRYRSTPMANASGPATAGFLPADFRHPASGISYRILEDSGKVWLSYERDSPARPLHGRQQLLYFIGSGKRGRTYLFEQQGYWFESPINWYAKQGIWDMAPAFQSAHEMPLTLPVDPGCLHCHASGVASSLPDARNRYAGEPFASGGINCESCHGDAHAHVASAGKIRMIDIARLAPVRRDSICLNCHLEGQTSIDRNGKRPEDFRPGDDLFDYSLFFVRKTESGSGGRATSQWEALLRSACKRKSGDRLTCTTCHDPHGDPAPGERIAWYRQKCLQCHDQAGFAQHHHVENPDCTACHMGRPASNDIAHEQVTDHWIRRRVSSERLPLATSGTLESIGGIPVSDRDLGFAYAQLANAGDKLAAEHALDLLRKAEKESAIAPDDHQAHAQLGYLEQLTGNATAAAAEYRAALAADSYDAIAAGNLALIEAEDHHPAEAAALWSEVFAHDPAEITAGFNLAVVECEAGEPGASLQTLDRILQFSPDNDRARAMAGAIRSGRQICSRTGAQRPHSPS